MNGGERIAAHLFIIDGGFVFADMGWNEPLYSGHPFHMVECELTKSGYIDTQGRRLDIYIGHIETSGRGERETCRRMIRESLSI